MYNLQEKVDYYFNEEGFMVFTTDYLLRQNKCCGNGCINCPYQHVNVVLNNKQPNVMIVTENKKKKTNGKVN